MRVLVTGAAGLLGTEVVTDALRRGHEAVALDLADMDITDGMAARSRIGAENPDAVIHCAAYTAVDRAEAEAELAMRVNRDGAGNVSRAAAAAGAVMVYVSTDFVFDGRAEVPYRPTDDPNPLSVYGRSKLEGEKAVSESGAAHLIVRTSWLYGARGRDFISAILRRAESGEPLAVVGDQRGRPTWSRNLARTLLDLTEGGARGTWHATDGGETSWYGLAEEALILRGMDVAMDEVTTEAWGAPAPRPRFSVLDVSATEGFLGRRMMPWRTALADYLAGS